MKKTITIIWIIGVLTVDGSFSSDKDKEELSGYIHLPTVKCSFVYGSTMKDMILGLSLKHTGEQATATTTKSALSPPTTVSTNQSNVINYHDQSQSKDTKCHYKRTMAWSECSEKLKCKTSCTNETNCQFPYCNSLGECECNNVSCKTNRMCLFYRIECKGRFACRNNSCFCELN